MKPAVWIVLGVILAVALIFGAYFFVNRGGSAVAETITNYSTSDKERPKIEVKTAFSDLGKMKVSDEKSADFTIKNIGQKPLQLSRISSSCNCTFGQVIIDGKESEFYGMHSISALAGEILPGKTGAIRVIYRPYIMPVYGPIDREVYMETNDPENPNLVFKVRANVE